MEIFFLKFRFPDPTSTVKTAVTSTESMNRNLSSKEKEMAWYCRRGITVRRLIDGRNNSELVCLCPPAYYGPFCEYQNQRVSLSIQVKAFSYWYTVYIIVMTLRDDQQGLIESHAQFYYLSIHSCRKFNFNLLYSTRPKNASTNHSVNIDIYKEDTLEFYASWSFPVRFSFLPVHLMVVQLQMPTRKVAIHVCEGIRCGIHGHCYEHVNNNVPFCRCDAGWTGKHCDIPYTCHCSADSVCFGLNICLCPSGKFGPRCYFEHEKCSCENGGICTQNVKYAGQEDNFYCVCPEGYTGLRCEKQMLTGVNISFASDLEIPFGIRVHFIQAFARSSDLPNHHNSTYRKIPLVADTILVFGSEPFHIVFVEVERKTYYLAVFQKIFNSKSIVSSRIAQSNRCPYIAELFHENFAEMHLIRRIKSYHVPCKEQKRLACFYDESLMCICDRDLEQANCFKFNHSRIENCQGKQFCENDGVCVPDNGICPIQFTCVCDGCFFGSRCQYSTRDFILSLEIILGNQIRPSESFFKQRSSVKVIVAIVLLIFVCGLGSSTLCILTFRTRKSRETSCGSYIFVSSCNSVVVVIVFLLKFNSLITSQMGFITNRSFLLFNCKIMDFVLKILVNTGDWLNGCVGVDRAIIATKATEVNQKKSSRIARWIIACIYIVTILTHLHDPIYRALHDDEEEHRIWCIVQYTPSLRLFNSMVLFFHFFFPFILNIISSFIIIFNVARRRSSARNQQSYEEHLREQFYKLKHLLISPFVLASLALPQLIISFTSPCMKSFRKPWLFVSTYLLSFLPSTLLFIVFVLPSKSYRNETHETIKLIKQKLRRQ